MLLIYLVGRAYFGTPALLKQIHIENFYLMRNAWKTTVSVLLFTVESASFWPV